MLIINPSKPFYLNEKEKIIRMGNFKETGKEIEYEDNYFLNIFKYTKNPITKDNLINKITEETKYNKEDIDSTINYLIEEGFILNLDDINNILNDEFYNREKLYFYMLGEKNINLDFSDKRILILGLGGIGSITIQLLARAGFKKFIIVDSDKVEKSNLIRQLSYDLSDIGKLKIDVIEEKLYKISEDIDIKKINKFINNENDIIDEIKISDFVICTIDKPERQIRRIINDVCVKLNVPILFSGFSEHVGMIGPFIVPKKTACLSCIEKEDNDIPLYNVKTAPSYGPLCTLISSIVSDQVINYFIKFKNDSLIGKTMMFNMYTYETEIINWEKNKTCRRCGDFNDSK